MSDTGQARKIKAGPQSIEDEIAAAEEKLRKLRERKREADIKAREKNTKAVLELLRNEKLDLVQSAVWESALPKIRAALFGEESAVQVSPGAGPVSAAPTQAAGAGSSAGAEQPAAAAA